jgi:hypothetical protein
VAFTTTTLQLVAQLPQAVVLLTVDVSQPVLPVWQWPNPLLHVNWQLPAEHDEPVSLTVLLHAKPHLPQLPVLVSGSVQVELQQSEVAPVHARPQPLQFPGSDEVSMQRPPQHFAFPGHVPPSAVHASTHTPPGLHFLPPVQLPSFAHSTHWCSDVLQKGALGLKTAHSELALQPGAHTCVGRQYVPTPQLSAAGRHSTHCVPLHFGYLGSAQSVSTVHGQSGPLQGGGGAGGGGGEGFTGASPTMTAPSRSTSGFTQTLCGVSQT